MSMRKLYLLVGALVFVSGCTVAWAAQSSTTHSSSTVSGFVDLLIERGIVPEYAVERARELTGAIERIEEAKKTSGNNVRVKVSQLIEYADLTYAPSEDIKGLLLLVTNETNTTMMMEAKRRCQIIYRIYAADSALVYSSADEQRCQTDERVQYTLAAGATRMFEIEHLQSNYSLRPGTYRFVLEYPEYGYGEKLITVQ